MGHRSTRPRTWTVTLTIGAMHLPTFHSGYPKHLNRSNGPVNRTRFTAAGHYCGADGVPG